MANFEGQLFQPLYDPVCLLLETPFYKWRQVDQIDLISGGRPNPSIQLRKRKRRAVKPSEEFHLFRKTWYERYIWLCGSTYTQCLYCWPCLLFGDEKNRWCCDRFELAGNVPNVAFFVEHESDQRHKECLSKLIAANINSKAQSLISSIPEDFRETSESVRLNRRCAQYAIDAILIMIKRRFPFLELPDETTANHSDFVTLAVSLGVNEVLKSHFRKMMIGRPNPVLNTNIQAAILDSIADCIDAYIFDLVKSSRFFSIRIDDGLNELNECAIFIRCIDCQHRLKEYFLGYFSLGADKTSLSLFRIVDMVLEKYQYKTKLTGICFDITCVKFNYLKDLRVGLKFMAPQAIPVNLLGHSIDYMLERCLCSITTCRVFFSHLTSLLVLVRDFYKKNYFGPLKVWHDVASSNDSCCSKARLLSAITDNESYEFLKNVLIQVQRDDTTTDETLYVVSNILDKLKDFEFLFLAVIFNHIFKLTDTLFKDLLNLATDVKACHERVKQTCATIYKQRNEQFFNCLHSVTRIYIQLPPGSKVPEGGVLKDYKPLYYEIVDNVIMELHTRYENMDQYEFVGLGNSSNFGDSHYSISKHESASLLIDNLATHFPSEFIHKGDLKRDWRQMDNRKLCNMNLTNLLQHFSDDRSNYHYVYKVFSLVLLLTPIDRDCGTMCLHKIKPYLEKSVAADMRPAMAKILMNPEVFSILNSWSSFKDDILDKLSDRYSAIKLSHMVKPLKKPDDQTISVPMDTNPFLSIASTSSVDPEPNIVVDVDPTGFIIPDIPGSLPEVGVSSSVEPDSSMNDDLTVTMTCEKFPVDNYSHCTSVRIKQEPEDPSDILSANVERELNRVSHEPPSASNKGGSLFQTPVLIKEEIISSEEEL